MPLPTDPIARLPRPIQWLLLVILSGLFVPALQAVHMPAALLLGPMIAAILMGLGGTSVRVPRTPYYGAQSIIGIMIAGVIEPSILGTLMKDGPLFLGAVIATVTMSSFIGYLLSRWRILPGTAGVWGSAPGAASAMVVMAEAFGADVRLVAFMLYMRVVCVALFAAIISRLWVDTSGASVDIVWFPAVDWQNFAITIAVALACAWAGRRLRLPSGAMLMPMVVGIVLHISGVLTVELPEWLLGIVYAALGWNIGLGFNRKILAQAARALPQILLSIGVLIAFCGGLAFLMVKFVGVDPLTAYLATSPGGMDSIAIIAASTSNVDLPFVMALQTARFLIVMLAGPPLARFVARRVGSP